MSNYFDERQAKAVEKAVKKAVTKAVEETKHAAEKEAKEKTVLSLIELGKLTLEEIAKCTGLTLRRVQALAKTL